MRYFVAFSQPPECQGTVKGRCEIQDYVDAMQGCKSWTDLSLPSFMSLCIKIDLP